MCAYYICYIIVDFGRVRFVGFFFFQAEDGIRDLVRSRGLGDVYKRQVYHLFDFVIVDNGWRPLFFIDFYFLLSFSV